MEKLYPLELSCILKTPIWSGTRLGSEWGKGDGSAIGESWELSVRRGDCSTVRNGAFAGQGLWEVIERYRDEITGGEFGAEDFPLLIKLIDAASDLSVQVHPDDEFSALLENDRGKTEMWYILQADEGARLAIGLKEGVSKDELRAALQEGRAESLLNYVPVSPGEVYFIPARLSHAIGKGILVAEIQQNCDITYRLYDYGRLGNDGKPRELHIDKGLKVVRGFDAEEIEAQRFSHAERITDGLLAHCQYFKVERISTDGVSASKIDTDSRMLHLLVIDGEGAIRYGGVEYPLAKGSSYLLPASLGEIELLGRFDALISGTGE